MKNTNSLVADSSTDGSNDVELQLPFETKKTTKKDDYSHLMYNILNIKNDTKEVRERFTQRNNEYKRKIKDKMKMNITYEKEFKDHLQKKLNKLDNRLNILQMKYTNYKMWYDRFNIMIIIISSLLSIFEALRNEMDDIIYNQGSEGEENESLIIFFNMVPIGISSTITCSAAIIKFKKYQEKMENMQFTREKVINSISKIKTVQESLWFSTNEKDFYEIKKKYLEDVYMVYNESNFELERHIKFNDHYKFLKMYREPPPQKDKKVINYL